nr:MAG TPA: hypothetical protein [Caudoviricetes sp.]
MGYFIRDKNKEKMSEYSTGRPGKTYSKDSKNYSIVELITIFYQIV